MDGFLRSTFICKPTSCLFIQTKQNQTCRTYTTHRSYDKEPAFFYLLTDTPFLLRNSVTSAGIETSTTICRGHIAIQSLSLDTQHANAATFFAGQKVQLTWPSTATVIYIHDIIIVADLCPFAHSSFFVST